MTTNPCSHPEIGWVHIPLPRTNAQAASAWQPICQWCGETLEVHRGD